MRVTTPTVSALALALAFAIDQLFGEPPARVHPVVGMGILLRCSGAPWERASHRGAFVRGAVCWMLGACLWGGMALVIAWVLTRLATRFGIAGEAAEVLVLGMLLKPMLAWQMLYREVAGVGSALEISTLDRGRQQLRSLVSRDTAQLSETEVRESALESLAENLNDSLVAPVFWFLIGGLPAAVVYRFANTADAMWGYRGRWEWSGKWAARADDVLSFIPARLTALLLALARLHWPKGLLQVAAVTPSPNGGWPMGALALILGVRLSKPGVYVLNPLGSAVRACDFTVGLAICARAARLTAVLAVTALLVVGWRQ